jgi:acetyltransferase-like isoleucine patch superfamily enzyme
MAENAFTGLKNRLLQMVARSAPGAMSLRPMLHRWRGVKIGQSVWIGYDAILETSYPYLISIGDRVIIGVRTTIIAHFQEIRGVNLESDIFIGPGVLILPGVTVGKGSVITAGSVVTSSVPPATLVQGNPAKAIARCGMPLGLHTPSRQFATHLKRL